MQIICIYTLYKFMLSQQGLLFHTMNFSYFVGKKCPPRGLARSILSLPCVNGGGPLAVEELKKQRDLTGRRGRHPLQPFAQNDKKALHQSLSC